MKVKETFMDNPRQGQVRGERYFRLEDGRIITLAEFSKLVNMPVTLINGRLWRGEDPTKNEFYRPYGEHIGGKKEPLGDTIGDYKAGQFANLSGKRRGGIDKIRVTKFEKREFETPPACYDDPHKAYHHAPTTDAVGFTALDDKDAVKIELFLRRMRRRGYAV